MTSGDLGADAQAAPMLAAHDDRRGNVLDQFDAPAAEIARIGLAQNRPGRCAPPSGRS